MKQAVAVHIMFFALLIASVIVGAFFWRSHPELVFIIRSSPTHALGDIQGIELLLAKMINDAGVATLPELFDSEAIADYLADGKIQGTENPVRITNILTTEQFDRAQSLYTNTCYSLLRRGRRALNEKDRELNIPYRAILKGEKAQRLSTSYLENRGNDPWGHLYRIWPGPWPKDSGDPQHPNPIVFRVHFPGQSPGLPDTRQAQYATDILTINKENEEQTDPDTGLFKTYGYAAPRDLPYYIWSTEKNEISGQAIYSNSGYTSRSYNPDQLPQYWGGGDDINNWDNDQTWMRFYL